MLKVIKTPLFWRKAAAVAALALSLGLCAFAGRLQYDRLPVSGPADAVEILCEHTLASFGWKTSGLISQEQVTLPETFGPTYDDFLKLQGGRRFSSLALRRKNRHPIHLRHPKLSHRRGRCLRRPAGLQPGDHRRRHSHRQSGWLYDQFALSRLMTLHITKADAQRTATSASFSALYSSFAMS